MSYKKKHNISKSAISSMQVAILKTNLISNKPPKVGRKKKFYPQWASFMVQKKIVTLIILILTKKSVGHFCFVLIL